jgi:hypothetical protein
MLSEGNLKVLKAITAYRATEAHHRWLTNMGLLSQIDNPHMNDFFAVFKNIVGHLTLGATHLLPAGLHGTDNISRSQI